MVSDNPRINTQPAFDYFCRLFSDFGIMVESLEAKPDVQALLSKAPSEKTNNRTLQQIFVRDVIDAFETVTAKASEIYPNPDYELPVKEYQALLNIRDGENKVTLVQAWDRLVERADQKRKLDAKSASPSYFLEFINSAEFPGDPNPFVQKWKELQHAIAGSFSIATVRLAAEAGEIAIGKAVGAAAQKSMNQDGKIFYLRKMLAEINQELKELGGGGEDDVLGNLKLKIQETKLSVEARTVAEKELKRLEKMSDQSPEYGKALDYLDVMLSLPWGKMAELDNDIAKTRKTLDDDHFGLEKVKQDVVEQVALQNHTGEEKGGTMCLVGPPGIGKTSIAKSIANATGRELIIISLGGVHDEADIRGHRRTYVGAMAGRIIQALSRAKTANPLIVLDELDKLRDGGQHGDPSAALLELLDPEQNHDFKDHYLNVGFDMSKAMFIGTANVESDIPGPLRDRMQFIRPSSYTQEEKFQIATRHLVPKQMNKAKVTADNIVITGGALERLISSYTYESGVRNLERAIGKLCKKVVLAMETAKSEGKTAEKAVITENDLQQYLGKPNPQDQMIADEDQVGYVNGLFASSGGGGILPLEACLQPGKELNLELTGSVQQVMTESAANARAVVRRMAMTEQFNDAARLSVENVAVHINVPNQAMKKDGPSAGAALATLLASVATNTPIRRDIAMTGELTLRGKVTAIGGLDQKLAGAWKAGVKTVLIPKENERDLEEIPQVIKDSMKIILVSTIEEVFAHALVRNNDEPILKPAAINQNTPPQESRAMSFA
ncbi:MAG: endopeptidase La [Alphaproteobacteria bacterium]